MNMYTILSTAKNTKNNKLQRMLIHGNFLPRHACLRSSSGRTTFNYTSGINDLN